MKLQTFTGGLNTRLDPRYLANEQGTVYRNIDNEKGPLVPVKDKVQTSIELDKYCTYYKSQDIWVSEVANTHYLEYQGVLYSSNGSTRPRKFNGTESNFLGIVSPSTKPNIAIYDRATPFEAIGTESGELGDLPSFNTPYMLFNVSNNIYSQPLQVTVSHATYGVPGLARLIDYYENSDYRGYISFYNRTTTNVSSIEFSDLIGEFGDEAKLYRLYKNKWHLVHTFTSETETFTDTVYDISANDELEDSSVTNFNGTYQYVYTYYNINDGTESEPSELTDELLVDGGYVELTNLTASTDPQVTHKRIYRVGRDITQFSLVSTIENSETTFVDNIHDDEIEGTLLESENYGFAPAGLNFLQESYGMLFGAIGTKVRFTPIGKPNAWPEEYFLEFREVITGLGPVANGVLVMTEDSTYIITGTGPTILAVQPLRGDQGCVSADSVQEIAEGMVMWASKDGLCASSGNNVSVVTKNMLGKRTLDPVASVVHDEVYYVLDNSGIILCWDYRYTPIVKELDLDVEFLVVGEDILYGWKDGYLHELFKSDDYLSLSFTSAEFGEGRYTLAKAYNKFYFDNTGDITVTILLDGREVKVGQLTGDFGEVLQPNVANQRGSRVQFEITGTGTVHEIYYEVAGQDK